MTENEEANLTTEVSNTTSQLNEREIAIIQHLANGLTTRELASETGITFNVAQNTLKSIRSKLGVGTASAVVAFAFRNKLIT
ncbi:MAG: response regulator transcription factor [Chitinophagales bacterium]|nr:response regulator transcription factor [Chitinophagales bacterium]